MTQPFAQNVVWGPHFYAQSVIPFDLPKQYMQVNEWQPLLVSHKCCEVPTHHIMLLVLVCKRKETRAVSSRHPMIMLIHVGSSVFMLVHVCSSHPPC
jgi:hypothetical protein